MRFHEILFQTDSESFSFYLEKQKSFIPKKKFLSCCQFQNKKALFTDPICSEGFGYKSHSPVEPAVSQLNLKEYLGM